MQQDHYPFIDLAVHDAIRDRFAAGDALAIASLDLSQILWANGPAASLFGYQSIYDLIEEGIAGQPALMRQIEGAAAGLDRKQAQDAMIRVSSGFRRGIVAARIERISLTHGRQALLISSAAQFTSDSAEQRAERIIKGFDGTETHVAVLDGEGRILAASPSFTEAQLSGDDLARMAADVGREGDRLVKRLLQGAAGAMPAAIGRLTDDPALNLVLAVEPASETGPMDDIAGEEAPATSNGLINDAGYDGPADDASNDIAAAHLEAESVLEIEDDIAIPRPDMLEAGTHLWDASEPGDFLPELADAPAANWPEDDRSHEDFSGEATISDIADSNVSEDVETTDDAAVIDDGQDFVFDPAARPARFVWRIDHEGAFSEVSPEFAETVGPNAADIIGRKFPDIARVFNLDQDHIISDLLSRRDTWSGKTVNWPVQGTDLVVPVDLAALPTYTRERKFDGFRGFGIVRVNEAHSDSEAIGLALVPGAWKGPVKAETQQIEETVDESKRFDLAELDTDTSDFALTADEDVSGDGLPDELLEAADDAAIDPPEFGEYDVLEIEAAGEEPDKDDSENGDPFRGEAPALHVSATPERRESDKVISLETRRQREREALSPLEQAAFREIGEKLGSRLNVPAETKAEAAPGKLPSADEREDDNDVKLLFAGVADDDSAEAEDAANEAEDAANEADEADTIEPAASLDDFSDSAEMDEDAHPAVSEPEPEKPAERRILSLASNYTLPARQASSSALTEAAIDVIPAALLVHAGDRLIHANRDFLALTGYDTLGGLRARGGIDSLIIQPEDRAPGDDGAVTLMRADGTQIPVTAKLRSVNWHDTQALLLALTPLPVENRRRPANDDGVSAAPLAIQAQEDQPARSEDEAQIQSDADRTALDDLRIQADELRIEADELRTILDTATDGVVIIGEDNRIRSMNGSARALFGYDDEQTQNQPFAMLFAQESQRAVMDYLNGLAEHGVSSVLNDGREVSGREAGGGQLPMFMTIGRLSGSKGYCAVLRDITQWKRNEEELRNAKRAAEDASSHKSEFLARVSHEIRTPLNAIIGFSEMMVEERFGPIGSPRYLEYAHDIGSSGKHVLDIVNDLLDISKIEAGEIDLDFNAVSLNTQLAECVSMLQPMANSQRVIVRTSLSVSVPDVVADNRSIKQIALNLLANAIRYTPAGGQVVVSTSHEANGNVVLRIRDTGIGMSRKELEQAMKPFGQVNASTRKRGEGTGLGLPLTKAMVEANRAVFDIVSTPQEGTLVTVTFPPQRVLAD